MNRIFVRKMIKVGDKNKMCLFERVGSEVVGIIKDELGQVFEVKLSFTGSCNSGNYTLKQSVFSWDFKFHQHLLKAVHIQLPILSDVKLVEYFPENELFVGVVSFLQKFEADGSQGSLDLLRLGQRTQLVLMTPLCSYEVAECVIRGNIDGEVSVKIEKFSI